MSVRAMVAVMVSALVEDRARIEIEAVVPEQPLSRGIAAPPLIILEGDDGRLQKANPVAE
jgi:hypothetical protein